MPDWEAVKASLPVGKSEEDKEKRKELWQKFNVTNPRSLDLFELDAGIQLVLECEELFEAKEVIRRAYTYAREVNPNGPSEKLEFVEFRLLLVYLKGLFEVHQVFSQIDSGSRDLALSKEELEGAGEKFAALGISVEDPGALWEQLKGTNEVVEFHEFANWATRQGMAGPELLEVELANDARAAQQADEELAQKLKETLKGWSKCSDGMVASTDMGELLKRFLPDLGVTEIQQLLEGGVVGEDGKEVSVDNLIDSIVLSPYF